MPPFRYQNRNVLLHEAMRRARQRAGFTQTELARRCKIRQQRVSDFERGAAVPSVYEAFDLADALGISIEVYLGLRDPNRTK